MTPQEPIVVSIPAHHTPHPSDPPDAHEFYAALGMLSVAWGRLEGDRQSARGAPDRDKIFEIGRQSSIDRSYRLRWRLLPILPCSNSLF